MIDFSYFLLEPREKQKISSILFLEIKNRFKQTFLTDKLYIRKVYIYRMFFLPFMEQWVRSK